MSADAKLPLLEDASQEPETPPSPARGRARVQTGLLIALCALLATDALVRLRFPAPAAAARVARRSTWGGETIRQDTEAVRLLGPSLVDAAQPSCSWPSSTLLRFRNFTLDGPVFVAANLYDSEDVLKTWIVELPRFVQVCRVPSTALTVQYVGPHLVHLSIYENGSTDSTVALLGHLARTLLDLGASVTIHAAGDAEPRPAEFKRIPMLAALRNRALAPLTDPAVEAGQPFTSVLCAAAKGGAELTLQSLTTSTCACPISSRSLCSASSRAARSARPTT